MREVPADDAVRPVQHDIKLPPERLQSNPHPRPVLQPGSGDPCVVRCVLGEASIVHEGLRVNQLVCAQLVAAERDRPGWADARRKTAREREQCDGASMPAAGLEATGQTHWLSVPISIHLGQPLVTSHLLD